MARLVGLAGAALLVIAAFAIHDDQPFPGFAALVPVAGTVLLILAGTHVTVGVSRLLSARPMVAIGDISYSWYLWHWPLIVFTALLFPNRPVALVVAAALSVVPSLLSYRYVEQPLRRYRPRTRPRATAIIAATIGIPVALCAALLVGANSGWGLATPTNATVSDQRGDTVTPADGDATAGSGDTSVEPPAEVDVQDGDVAGGEGGSLRSQHAVVKAGCVNTDLDPRNCRFGPADARGTILLAGDSQAYALADGVIAAGERLGLDTIATSHTGCPFLARESSGVHNYPCRSWQNEIVEYALAERPSVVVITNRSGGYVRPGKEWRTIARDDGGRAESVDEARELYRRGLEPVVRELTDAGIPVIVVSAVPEMTGYTDPTSLLSGVFGTQAFEVSRADAEDERRPAVEVEQDLASSIAGLSVVDPNPALCSDDTCSTQRDGQPVYQDETHLSLPGSLLLTDTFESAISQAVGGTPAPR